MVEHDQLRSDGLDGVDRGQALSGGRCHGGGVDYTGPPGGVPLIRYPP
jgi:hypothetical protein